MPVRSPLVPTRAPNPHRPLPGEVGVENPAPLGHLDDAPPSQVTNLVANHRHEWPPGLTVDHSGDFGRADGSVGGPSAGESHHGGAGPFAASRLGGLPPRVASFPEGHLGLVHLRACRPFRRGIVATFGDRHRPTGRHECVDEFLTEAFR